MKKQFLIATCGCLTLFFSNVTAQTDNLLANNFTNFPKDVAKAVNNTDHLTTYKLPPTSVTSKVMRSFNQSFKDVNNAEWYGFNKSYLAEFTLNGRMSRALFAKNGSIVYTVITGSEKNLPAEDRRAIKSNYVDYTIGTVNEVHSDNLQAWVVNLQDDKNFVVARVADGSVEELAHYKLPNNFKTTRKGKIIIPQ